MQPVLLLTNWGTCGRGRKTKFSMCIEILENILPTFLSAAYTNSALFMQANAEIPFSGLQKTWFKAKNINIFV